MALSIELIDKNLSNIECIGTSFTKHFVIHSTGSEVFSLTISDSDTFSIFPSTDGKNVNVEITDSSFAFSVIYDAANATGVSSDMFASLTASENITFEGDSGIVVIGPTTSLTFTVPKVSTVSTREIGSLYLKNKDSESVIDTVISNKEHETSFGVIRTNPKLTGNVKITVDSDNNIWLNSIDATKDLSSDKYKKFKITEQSSYASDLNAFMGNLATNQAFYLYQYDDKYTSTKSEYSEQYDKFYEYGAEQLNNFYDEEFSIFAPLYMKNTIPEYFVVFRTEGPINKFSYDTPFSEWSSSLIEEVFSKSTIIKTFNLKDNAIGKYLQNIIDHPSRTSSDMSISFEKNGFTTFNGISYREGTFVQKGELLNDFYSAENTITATEEHMTLGFERNGIFSSHLINLEFLFNDDTAKQYSINRYFGLYVNEIELAKFLIDEDGFVENSLTNNQLPIPRKGVDTTLTSQASFTQTNENGIKIYASNIETTLTPSDFTSVVTNVVLDDPTFTITLPGNAANKFINGETVTLYAFDIESTANVISSSYSNNETSVILDYTTFNGSYSVTLIDSIDFYSAEKLANFNLNMFDSSFITDQSRIFCVKDVNGNLHNVKDSAIKIVHKGDETQQDIELTLQDTELDITDLTGFLDIITQTSGTVIDTIGKSSLYVKVNDYLSPNDYIEINWNNGQTASEYPHRYRVIVNNSYINPGQSWHTYSTNYDENGAYYFTYFHGGNSNIELETLVSSIQDAFDTFEGCNFEVLAKDTTLYFRSTQSGLESENQSLIFSTYVSNKLSIMGVEGGTGGEVNFIGASKRKHTRAKITKSVANGMLSDEYISTKGNFSLAKRYSILDDFIVSAPYLEEPVYDDTDKLIDFIGCDIYHTIVLDNESQGFQTTFDKKITSYEIFKPSFSILSILPMKDFDTDFYSSDYARTYKGELNEYFDNYIAPITITEIDDTLYTFDRSLGITASTSFPFLVITDTDEAVPYSSIQFRFGTTGATAELLIGDSSVSVPTVGDTILLMPDKKIHYFNEDALSKFKGFFSLAGISTIKKEAKFNVLENQWNPTRFDDTLNTEYERLQEIYQKDLVLKSRVVPFISKWVMDGKDVRENNYRFNYSRAFGTMNFSPSINQDESDPQYHTHEWPYIDSISNNYNLNEQPFSYMFESIDNYDFSSVETDWFSIYFSTGYPSELTYTDGIASSYASDTAEKYSYFNYEEFSKGTYTFFRGQKIQIIPTLEENLKNYNGYRFSTIINTEPSNIYQDDPIQYNTIINKKWKFIVVIITIKVCTFRYLNGNLNYVDFYTLENRNNIVTLKGDDTLTTYDTVYPSDYKLSSGINFSTSSIDGYFSTLIEPLYNPRLDDEIPVLSTGNFSKLVATQNVSVLETTLLINEPSDVTEDSVSIENRTSYALRDTGTTIAEYSLPSTMLAWSNFNYYYINGGDNAYNAMRKSLSFYEIANVMVNDSETSTMTYKIYDETGVETSDPDFTFKFILPHKLSRTSEFIPIADTNKPSEFFDINIGAELISENNNQILYRYSGNYNPKFKNVLKFWMRESEDFTIATNKDYLLSNTHIGTELQDFSVIKNRFFNKISDEEILTLVSTDGYDPVYPYINEISIDKKDVHAWSSSWDAKYYNYYNSISENIDVIGTSSMKEIKSLFGSKMMKVPTSFSLYEYTVGENSNTSEISYTYSADKLSAILSINVYERFLRELLGTDIDLKAKTTFLETMNLIPDSFSEDDIDNKIKSYLELNIMNLYEIEQVDLFVLQTGDPDTGVIATVNQTISDRPFIETLDGKTLTEDALYAKGYIVNNNTKMTTKGNMVFDITVDFNSTMYTSVSVGVSLRRI
jgi:hypothetical protein